ncbi:MAG: MarR family winged helix-turn-helix transcriptional regulator [Sporichthyaceae bacterium]
MTESPPPRWLDEREQQAWRGSLAMWARLQAELAREMAAGSELSMADFAVLVTLTEACGGRVRAFSLARELTWEKSRLSHQLTRMEKRGLVCRAECPEDARGQVVAVTEAGRAAIEAAAPAHVEAVRRLFMDHLRPDQIEALTEISATVLSALDTRPGGECPSDELGHR